MQQKLKNSFEMVSHECLRYAFNIDRSDIQQPNGTAGLNVGQ